VQLSLLDRLPAPSATLGPRGLFGTLRPLQAAVRVDLGEGAWLDAVRGFLPGHARLLADLWACADWEQHERQMYDSVVAVPRLVAACPGSGDVGSGDVGSGDVGSGDVGSSGARSGGSVVRVLCHRASPEEVQGSARWLRGLGRELSQRYAKVLESISLALYRDGQDSVAFHGDRLGALRQDTVVAILSLGAPRRFLIRRAPGRPGALPASLIEAGIGAPCSRKAERPTFALSLGEGDLLVMGGTCQETWEHGVPKQKQAGPRIAVMFREAWDEADREGAGGGVRNVRGPAFTSAGEPAWPLASRGSRAG